MTRDRAEAPDHLEAQRIAKLIISDGLEAYGLKSPADEIAISLASKLLAKAPSIVNRARLNLRGRKIINV